MTMTKTLYRATVVTSPYFGFGSSWAETLEHAERYTRMLGFGGPAIYVVDDEVRCSEVLDLRDDPVAPLAERGFDPYSQGEGVWLPDEIFRIGKLKARVWGHRWWLYVQDEPGGGVCWRYFGREPLPAKLLRTVA